MKKTALIIALATTIQMSASSVFADYSDIRGHWAEGFINQLTNEGIVQGDSGCFRPDTYVNVDEFFEDDHCCDGHRGHTAAMELVKAVYRKST